MPKLKKFRLKKKNDKNENSIELENIAKQQEETLKKKRELNEFESYLKYLYENYANDTASQNAFLENFGSDPTQFAIDWSENDISPLSYTKRLRFLAGEINASIPDWLKDSMVGSFNFADVLLTNSDNAEKLNQLRHDGVRHKKEETLNIFLDAVNKDLTNTSYIFTALMATGVITGKAAAVINPVSSAALAALAWGVVAAYTVKVGRALHEYYSPSYAFKDKLIRYQKMQKKIDQLSKNIDELIENKKQHEKELTSIMERANQDKRKLSPDEEKSANELLGKIEKIQKKENKIITWLKRQEQVKQEAIDLSQVDNIRPSKKITDDLKQKFITAVKSENTQPGVVKIYRNQVRSTIGETKKFDQLLGEEASDATKRLHDQIWMNKRNHIGSLVFSTFCYSVMALGMTITAISPACAHAAPIVLAVGVGITVLGGGLKLGHYAITHTINGIAKYHANNKQKQALKEKYGLNDANSDQPLNKPPLSELSNDKKLQYKLAFEHSREKQLFDAGNHYHVTLIMNSPMSSSQPPDELKEKELYVRLDGGNLTYFVKNRQGEMNEGKISLRELSQKARVEISIPLKSQELDKLLPHILEITAQNKHTPDPKEFEAAWYDHLQNTSKKERKDILRQSDKRAAREMEHKSFCAALGLDPNNEAQDKQARLLQTRISNTDRLKIVKRQNRSVTGQAMKKSSKDFFKRQIDRADNATERLTTSIQTLRR